MLTQQRNIKRIKIIGGIVVFFLIVIGWKIYSNKSPETCSDKIKNQGERSVDCGGPCTACVNFPKDGNVEIKEKDIISAGSGKYDVLLEIVNPNNQFGISSFSYKVLLKDSEGTVLSERNGEEYLLPAEAKFIVETNLESAAQPTQIEVITGAVKWSEYAELQAPKLSVTNRQYNTLSSQPLFAEATGVLKNSSIHSYAKVKVVVVLRDAEDRPVGVNSSVLESIMPREEREFRLTWPNKLLGDVSDVKMYASTNVFDEFNYLKNEIPSGGPFQGYR